MWFSSWLRRRPPNRVRRTQHRPAARLSRPRLEALEERSLLSDGLTLTNLVPVSGTSDPFANNPNDQPSTQRGHLYPNSTVEPQVAVDPKNPNYAVAVWMQDRWSTGGARGLMGSVTFDASDQNAIWSNPVVIPGISATSESANNTDYLRASDPWVSIGPDGTVYISALSATLGPAIPVPADTAVKAITATLNPNNPSNPMQFGTPSNLITNVSPFPLDEFDDKPSITADPNKPGYAYAVWDQLDFPSNQAALDAFHAGVAIRENLFFSMTTNGGATWTPAQNVTNFQKLNSAFGNQLIVEPDGTLVDVCTLFNGSGNQSPQAGQTTLAVIRSSDGGHTWSNPVIGPAIESTGVTDPDTGQPVRDGEFILDVTADPNNGNLYAVWADGRFSNFTHEDIAFSMSTDGGLTWSNPIKVNQTPANIPAGDQQAFTPSVAEAANGTVAVSYYDFRNNTADPGLPTDYWLVHASSDFKNPASWQGNEQPMTNMSFNLENAPSAGGLFLGDYQGLAAGGDGGNSFYALFAQAGTASGTADIRFRDPAPATTPIPTATVPASSAGLSVNPSALGSSADAGSSGQPALPSLLMSLLSEEQKEWEALVESLVQEWQAVWLDLTEQILAAEGSELT
jgi:hypothetical protein